MKSFVMIAMLCIAFTAEARPFTGKLSSFQQIMGKAKRDWLRSSVSKERPQSWLALVVLPAVLLTAPVKAEVKARPLTQGLANLSQQRVPAQVAAPHENSYNVDFSEASTIDYTNNRSWILYYGGGNGVTAQGEEFQTYYSEIHGSDYSEQVDSVRTFGVGLRDPGALREVKFLFFDSTAGAAEEKTMLDTVTIQGNLDNSQDWLFTFSGQLFGFDGRGIVGPFRYAPLSLHVGSSFGKFTYYTYTPLGEEGGEEYQTFARENNRTWQVGSLILQGKLEMLNLNGIGVGLNYIGIYGEIPPSIESGKGFKHVWTISASHKW